MDTLLVVGQLQTPGSDLERSLKGSGFSLVETRDPHEAVSICRQTHPSLALVEVDSPDGDNLNLLLRMRSALSPSGRIVAICNHYSDALDDHCERLGANLALPKVDHGADFTLFLRGLMTLIPGQAGRSSTPVSESAGPSHRSSAATN